MYVYTHILYYTYHLLQHLSAVYATLYSHRTQCLPAIYDHTCYILLYVLGFDRLKIKLKSYQVDDVMESRASLTSHIVNNIKQDLSSQVAQIAGSLALFGSPVGFANKIGHGVKVSFTLLPYSCMQSYAYSLYTCMYMCLCLC